MRGRFVAASIAAWVLSGCAVVGYPVGTAEGATPPPASTANPADPGAEEPRRGPPDYRRDRAPERPAVDPMTIPDPIPRPELKAPRGNMEEYEVWGRRYRTLDTSDGYVAEGRASWYGQEFHGRPTSSGEPYDMYAMSGAHRTLPLPTYLEVTNLDNGRTVVVRVNDRGPFHEDRILDVSYAAAVRLGMIESGTARVRIRALEPAAR